MSKEHSGVSLDRLSERDKTIIFAPVAATRYNVCDQGIRNAVRAIATEFPRIPAENLFWHTQFWKEAAPATPAPVEPQAAASVALSATATVETPTPLAGPDPTDNFAVDGLAHAAYEAAPQDDPAAATRALGAWQRSGYDHNNAINPNTLRQAANIEAPTFQQEQAYVNGLEAVIADPSQQVQAAQDRVDQAFSSPSVDYREAA